MALFYLPKLSIVFKLLKNILKSSLLFCFFYLLFSYKEKERSIDAMKLSEDAKAKKREYAKKWREANKQKLKAYHKKWRKENPEKIEEYQRNYWEKQVGKE